MSEKVKVLTMNAAFDCGAQLICRTKEDLMNNINGALDGFRFDDVETGDEIIISVKEMTTDELDKLPEFDGC